ncbi:ead/Ea22-like family protein [Citrobacter braakii]|uniref:ead/Ea22-like family protein n=1 Tax=Citrobacter braakii TaxID=57706 RepID=UPI003D723FD3
MTALNKQALRQLATDAHELGIIKRYTKGIEANKRFVAIATPLTVLALLDELEAAEKRIAELESNEIREDGNQFLVVRHPGKTPAIKHWSGDHEEFLRNLIEQDPLVPSTSLRTATTG